MSVALKIFGVILFFALVLVFGERLVQWDVFGPRVSGIFSSNPEIKGEVRRLVEDENLRLSLEEWKNGMLHAPSAEETGIQYLAYHEDVLTTPRFYVVCEISEGERNHYRIQEGTEVFQAIREYHKRLMEERNDDGVYNWPN